jgi:hypothetical protein
MKEGIKSSTHPTAVGVTEVYSDEAYIGGDDIVHDLEPLGSNPFR